MSPADELTAAIKQHNALMVAFNPVVCAERVDQRWFAVHLRASTPGAYRVGMWLLDGKPCHIDWAERTLEDAMSVYMQRIALARS